MIQVSVIVPVYNVEKYLTKCLDSIMNQTFQDFELILIDDGSADNSGDICDRYSNEYANIIVIHQENQGQATARNNGVFFSNADWVLFIDSDDVIHRDLLCYLYNAATESKSGMAVCEREKSKNIPEDFFQEYQYTFRSENVSLEKLKEYCDKLKYFYWAPVPALLKKEIIVDIPFPTGRIYEDNAISCQLVYASRRLAIIPYTMYWYRDNPKGTMNQPLTEKKLDYLWALEKQINFFIENRYNAMCNKIVKELFITTLYYYDQCKKERNYVLGKTVKKYLYRYLKNYKKYLNAADKKIEIKTDKILRPKIYRVKKLLNVY